MRTSLFYKYSAIVLLVVNIAILAFLFFRPKGKHHHMPLKASKELNLTDDQKKNFMELVKNHQQSIKKIQDQQKGLFETYFQSLYKTDAANNTETLNAIVDFERQKIELTYHHFEKVKALLNKDQMLNYKVFILKTTQLIHGRKGIGPPPR
jgi:protein CpxP